MSGKCLKIAMFLLTVLMQVPTAGVLNAQKLITYEAGMGSRKAGDADVWILYQKVKAEHEGMWLYADSALLNTKKNDFTAYRHIRIILNDTTTITGDSMYYDGQTRVVNIWGDSAVLVDGKTILKTPQMSYDRNENRATYFWWGHTVNGSRTLDSRKGYYFSDTEDFEIYDEVTLRDSSSRLVTDTLFYNMRTADAFFVGPSTIYSDSATVFSTNGTYNTDSHISWSYENSRVVSGSKTLTGDTLFFDDDRRFGEAFFNVCILDTANNVSCFGHYGRTDQRERLSLVTDSALVIKYDPEKPDDTLFMHGDTVQVYNNADNEAELVKAYHYVKTYRKDCQGMADSANYWVKDSLVVLYGDPVLWYDSMQCTADTIMATLASGGLREARMRSNCMLVERLDSKRYNQVKSRDVDAFFVDGEPSYTDFLANAQMCYYITEEDSVLTVEDSAVVKKARKTIVGVNAGVSTDMRVYFKDNEPVRIAAFGEPDMQTYPDGKLPDDWRYLKGFRWIMDRRPRQPRDVFVW